MDVVIARVLNMMEGYLEALGSETPLEGQQRAQSANAARAAADEALAELDERLLWHEQLAAAPTAGAAMAALVKEAFSRTTGDDIASVGLLGLDLHQKVTGRADMDVGSGVGFLLVDIEAEFVLDRDRLWSVASGVFRYAEERAPRLQAAVQHERWFREFHQAVVSMHGAVVDFRLLSPASHRDRDVVRGLLTFAQDLHESLRVFLATLVSLKGSAPVSKWLGSDAADLIGILRQRGLADWLDGLSPTLRHARAHMRFYVDDEGIHLQNRDGGEELIAPDDLVNDVLAAYESANAIVAAVVSAASLLGGVELSSLDPLISLDLPPEEVAPIALGLFGYAEVTAVVQDGVIAIEAQGPAHGRHLAPIVGLASYLPETIETVELRPYGQKGGVLRGPIEILRRANEGSDNLAQQLAILQAQREWTWNGEPLLPLDYVRKSVAVHALQPEEEPAAMVRRLRVLRDFCAKAVGDREMAQSVESLLRLNRAAFLSQSPADVDVANVELLNHYVRLRLPKAPVAGPEGGGSRS